MKYHKTKVDLSTGVFNIWFRNLNPYGVKIKPLIEEWLKKTEHDFTDLSLVNFINNALPDCAMTQQQFDELDPKKKKYTN